MTNNLKISVLPITGMLGNGSMRGSMQQGWGPQGPIGGTAGPMMGQGVGPGRMVPNMNTALPPRGPPGSRAMVNMQMVGNGEKKKKKLTNWHQLSSKPELILTSSVLFPFRDGDGKPCLLSATSSAQSDCTMARPDGDYGSIWKPKQVQHSFHPKA